MKVNKTSELAGTHCWLTTRRFTLHILGVQSEAYRFETLKCKYVTREDKNQKRKMLEFLIFSFSWNKIWFQNRLVNLFVSIWKLRCKDRNIYSRRSVETRKENENERLSYVSDRKSSAMQSVTSVFKQFSPSLSLLRPNSNIVNRRGLIKEHNRLVISRNRYLISSLILQFELQL